MSRPIIFVSLGPGEPELITVKALRCLEQATTIYCTGTLAPSGRLMSRASKIMRELGIEKEKIKVFAVPMSKERALTQQDYAQTAKDIAERWQNDDEQIAVCAQGDASFYSSVYYISEMLIAQNIPVERIAGIPAFIAAGTLANIHIVKQEEPLRVIPGVVSFEELQDECAGENTVVIMKTPQSEEAIKKAIRQFSHSTFHYFENVGVKDKEFYTSEVANILNRKFPYFSLLIIQNKNR